MSIRGSFPTKTYVIVGAADEGPLAGDGVLLRIFHCTDLVSLRAFPLSHPARWLTEATDVVVVRIATHEQLVVAPVPDGCGSLPGVERLIVGRCCGRGYGEDCGEKLEMQFCGV